MDLDIKELRKDEQVEELEVRLPAAVWSERLEKELETLAERANLPGFRPGKAPRALLLRRYGMRSGMICRTLSCASRSSRFWRSAGYALCAHRVWRG